MSANTATKDGTKQAKAHSRAYPYYVVGVLMLAYMCSFIDRTILSLVLDPIKADLGLDEVKVSLLAGFAFALLYSVLGVPFGWLADRTDRTRLIFFGVIAWSLMTASCGLARSFASLFVARIGVGVGEATLSPASYSLIGDYFPRERLGLATSLYASGITIGGGLAMLVGGVAVSALMKVGPVEISVLGTLAPWQLAFVVVGLPGLLIALLMLTIREPVRENLHGDGGSIAEAFHYVGRRFSTLGLVILGYSFMVVINYALVIWVPVFYMRTFGMGPAEAGGAVGLIMLIAGTTGMISGGLLSDRLTALGRPDAPILVVLFSVLAQAPFFIASVLVEDAPSSLALMTAAVFLITMNGGLQGASIQILTPPALRGRLIAIFLLVANIVGLGIGPTATAAITQHVFEDPSQLGAALALTAAVVLPIATLLIALSLRRCRSVVESI